MPDFRILCTSINSLWGSNAAEVHISMWLPEELSHSRILLKKKLFFSSPLAQNAPSSSCSADCIVFKRQHSGINERNLSADFPYMSVSLIERRWLSITWLQGRRYLRTPPTQIHKIMDKNEMHCQNELNQWIYPIHIQWAYPILPFDRTCWDVQIPENELQHDIFTVQGQQSLEEAQRYHTELWHTVLKLNIKHTDESWLFPNQWYRIKQKLIHSEKCRLFYRLEN